MVNERSSTYQSFPIRNKWPFKFFLACLGEVEVPCLLALFSLTEELASCHG